MKLFPYTDSLVSGLSWGITILGDQTLVVGVNHLRFMEGLRRLDEVVELLDDLSQDNNLSGFRRAELNQHKVTLRKAHGLPSLFRSSMIFLHGRDARALRSLVSSPRSSALHLNASMELENFLAGKVKELAGFQKIMEDSLAFYSSEEAYDYAFARESRYSSMRRMDEKTFRSHYQMALEAFERELNRLEAQRLLDDFDE